MNLELDLENDNEFEESLEHQGGNFVDTKELPWVDSGLYKCQIASATLVHFQTGDSIKCTFVALDNDGVEPIGKFTAFYSVTPSDKFFNKTRELCYLTNNKKGLVESEMVKKDGTVITDRDGNPVYKYDGLCSNSFQLIATVLKKGENYGDDGTVYAKYAVYNLFGTDKRSVREKYLIEKKGADPDAVPPKDINNAYAYLKKCIKQQAEQEEALNNIGGGGSVVTPKPSPVKPVQPKPVSKPVAKKPVEPDLPEDDLPF